ncbi:ATP-binding protein [Ancylobacter defluvii]|uniref:ATP-binding protein n=1 Tax=Ancylobacter defluvii TaxID=1282440 RepID=UPI001BCA6F4B|nr:HAMP domain-containing histidine kinase [Ancylobacter defluvii]
MVSTAERDTANRENLFLLTQLRWLAVAGQVVTILIVRFGLGIELPLQEMGMVLACLVALNLATLVYHERRTAISDTELLLELLLDAAALTMQLYLAGGASNPFVSLYLLQVALGAVLLPSWSAWVLAGVVLSGFVLLMRKFRPLPLSEELHGDLFTLHIGGTFICFVLATLLLVAFITRIGRNLRDSDARLASLNRQQAEEGHIVRMGLLASGAAHELGTPLATVSVILSDWRRMQLLRDRPDLAEDIAEMQRQLDRCKAIVSGILMSSGEARGEGTLRTTAAAFFDGMMSEWQARRSPHALDYRRELVDDEEIISDIALKQIVFNLLDNAVEASPDWVGVSVRRHDDVIVLEVRDRGPGFTKDMLAAFGTPYNSTKGRPGGGLGLFLVVNVVRKLGGHVEAVNEAQGACVTLTLPLEALSAEA